MSDAEKVGAGGTANIYWVDIAMGGKADFVVYGPNVVGAIEAKHAARIWQRTAA